MNNPHLLQSDWNATSIADTGLTYKAIAPRPGTSAFASERFISDDEVHVAVVDESTNTVVERLTYLSKLSDAKTPEGASSYWKDYVNEYSGYIYAGAALSSADSLLWVKILVLLLHLTVLLLLLL